VPGGTPDQQAGTFMHELGHALGLKHGGGDDINFKPNYHSVMNFTWQMPMVGFDDNWTPDFSRLEQPDLDETSLDEAAGIGGLSKFNVPVGPALPDGAQVVPEKGPVDWNRDGDLTDTSVAADANWILPTLDPSPGELLRGYADWANLHLPLCGSPNFEPETHTGTTVNNEMLLARMGDGLHEIGDDCNGNGLSDDDELILQGDCNGNNVLDECDSSGGFSMDCNQNGVPDECDIASGVLPDANHDGIPDDCECALNPPVEVPQVRLQRSGGTEVALTWDPIPNAYYDVVQGSLEALVASEGDYGAAVENCLADNLLSELFFWDGSPEVGRIAFFLVRAVNCGGNGSYNVDLEAQDGLRDEGIETICP